MSIVGRIFASVLRKSLIICTSSGLISVLVCAISPANYIKLFLGNFLASLSYHLSKDVLSLEWFTLAAL